MGGGGQFDPHFFEHLSWPNCQPKLAEIFSLTSYRPIYFCPYFFWFQNCFDQNIVSTQKSLDLKYFRTTFFSAKLFYGSIFFWQQFFGSNFLWIKKVGHKTFFGIEFFWALIFSALIFLPQCIFTKNCLYKKLSDQKSFQSTFLLKQHIFSCFKQ